MFKSLKYSDNVLLFKLALIGFLVYKLSSFKLWVISERIFPIISISDKFQITSEIFHNSLSILGLLLISILIFRVYRVLLIPLIIVEFLLLATDVMRWQPAAYQYFLSIVIFKISPKYFKSYLILLLSATYFYGGLHKFDLTFININWSRTILLQFLEIPFEYINLKAVKAIGFIIPITEILAGVFLLTRWRKKALILIMFMHIFIIFFILKLGFFYKISAPILTWNLIMLVYAFIYYHNPICKKLKCNITTSLWVVLLYILPFLNLFGMYYPYFSFDIYSGAKFALYINVKLDKDSNIGTYAENKNSNYLNNGDVNLLAFNELGVPLTHNKWLYKRFISAYKRDFPESPPCFEISYYPFKTKELFE